MHETKGRVRMVNYKGHKPKLKVGDRVSFFIPSSTEKTELTEWKTKHMAQLRGSTTITKVMTPTTFTLEYKGHTYQSCLSELRPCRSSDMSDLDSGVTPDSTTSFNQGSFISYHDTDGSDDDDINVFVSPRTGHQHCGRQFSRSMSWHNRKIPIVSQW